VTEIYFRWREALKHLGPIIEAIPQLLIFSIFLFVAGLIDKLFSLSVQLQGEAFRLIVVASSFCALVFAFVVGVLLFTIIQSVLRPETSPFHSRAAEWITSLRWYIHRRVLEASVVIVRKIVPASELGISWQQSSYIPGKPLWMGLAISLYHASVNSLSTMQGARENPSENSSMIIEAFYSILSETYDDELLDNSSSVLSGILRQEWVNRPVADRVKEMVLTLEYLASPQASRRSILTVARVLSSNSGVSTSPLILQALMSIAFLS
jgi:uncharacterized membrane protein YdcZ (DUF606 family)